MQRIRPLSDDAAAQIWSSRLITSLNGAVLALLENSLDAGAKEVHVEVNFRLGSCTIHDDGHGIHPEDFAEDGGLLRLHHTSSAGSSQRHGYSGLVLASLAALSLLNITSWHEESNRCSHISVHRGRIIARCIPAASAQQRELIFPHGTRICVRDLFGNMPVRVKQRVGLSDSAPESNKLWQELTYSVVALLLAWPQSCAVRIYDAAGARRPVNISGWYPDNSKPLTEKSLRELVGKTIRADLRDALPILYQAGLAPRECRSLWIPVSAATSKVDLKGLICLQPAPTKRCQFIIHGVRPLDPESEGLELYASVNRQFSMSDFRTVEYDRKSVQGKKSEDGEAKSVARSKGVDRWPMFALKIEPRGYNDREQLHQGLNDTWLECIITVVHAAVTQWLNIQHFRPRDQRRKRRPDSASPAKRTKVAHGSQALPATGRTPELKSGTGSSPDQSGAPADHTRSRIRRGQRSFQRTSTWSGSMSVVDDSVVEISPVTVRPSSSQQDYPEHCSRHTGDDALSNHLQDLDDQELLSLVVHKLESPMLNDRDDRTVWTDPATRQAYSVDPRTGNILRHPAPIDSLPQGSSTAVTIRDERSRSDLRRPITLTHRQPLDAKMKNPTWLPRFLNTFENPVFPRQQEDAIPASVFGGPATFAQENCQSRGGIRGHHEHMSSATSTSLSREKLSKLKVIQQVDGKFILCKLQDDKDTLILVDQHAASERVVLERLLAELCTPASEEDVGSRGSETSGLSAKHIALEKPLRFQLATNEIDLLRQQSSRFARWGIFYDISRPTRDGQDVLVVRALPAGIFERCRLSPNLLIDLLRMEIRSSESAKASTVSGHKGGGSDMRHAWLQQIGSCPRGIIEMLNSRACRSAIMFNDILSLKQCEELLADLARCAFPFMCAHGRVSMVPLMELGRDTPSTSFTETLVQGSDFGGEFRQRLGQWMKDKTS